MMKKILFLAALMLAAMPVLAGNVDLSTAQSKATDFLRTKAYKARLMTSAPTIKWTHEVKNSNNAALAAYYIVNTDKGYVIVSGDDRAREILAYGDGCLESMNDLPDAVQFFLNMYKAQMEYLQAHPGQIVKTRNTSRGISVAPMLTTLWNQGSTSGRSPYNRLCPQVGGMTCLVGCAAVSLAQVMNYWKYPASSPALPAYVGPSGVAVDSLAPYDFDWDHMLNSYKNDNWSEEERDAIANLMRYVGQAENMDYGTDRSGADEDQMLQAIQTFGYDPGVHYMLKNDYDSAMTELVGDEEWISTMQAELLAGRPLMYCAAAAMSTGNQYYGHAFNVDGYNADDDTYHVNFGQSEDYNGYFAFNDFGYGISYYRYFQLMFVGMQPPTGPAAPRIMVSPETLNMQCYTGETDTAMFNVVGVDLTEGITVALSDADGVFSTDVANITVEDAGNAQVTVIYAPQAEGNHTATITLSSADADDVVVTLNGTATNPPLVTYDPVMQPADSNYIRLTSFRADWTDQTIDDNVTCYTLEVSTMPVGPTVGDLLAEADWSDLPKGGNVVSHASDYMPEGWGYSFSDLYLDGGCISMSTDDYFYTNTLDLTGLDKVTVVIVAQDYNPTYMHSGVTISNSVDEEYVEFTSSYEAYTVVLDCSESEQIRFTADYYPDIRSIRIYAGEVTAPQLRATETGNETYRLITGITDKFYTVENLAEAGTFLYKVKAIYTDGTESAWSNIQEVTLFDNGPAPHGFDPGDLNHDGSVSIKDVTALIDYLLGSDVVICTTCADVTGDSQVTIKDVTNLIDMLLGGGN